MMSDASSVRGQSPPGAEPDWAALGVIAERAVRHALGGGAEEDVQDLAAVTMQQLLLNWRKGEVERPEAMLWTIARARVKDRIRSFRRQRRIFSEMPEGFDPVDTTMARPGDFPVDRTALFRFTALNFFESRDERCRVLLGLRCEGADWKTIATDLGEPSTALRKRFSRCLKMISDAFQGDPRYQWLREELGYEL